MLATLIYGQAFADETAREGDGIIYIPVLRVGPSDGEASVRYATCPAAATNTAATTACGTLEGTATPGTDYTVATGIVEFADGETSKRIGVTLIDDSIDEENETLHFVLYDPTGLEITEESVVTVGTITDDDPAPRLNADSPSVGEDAGSMVFTAMLDRASARSLAVPWETADRTATAGEDYTQSDGTLSFAPGDTSATLSIPITDDDIVEAPETLEVEFTPVAHVTIVGVGIGTIEDNDVNDGLPWLLVRGGEVNESAGSLQFTLTLTGASQDPVNVAYETVDGTAKESGGGVADSDYTATGMQSLTIAPGTTEQTVSVAIANDDVWEGDETFGLHIVSVIGAVMTDDAEATILDDESKPQPGGVTDSYEVGEGDGSVSIAVRLSGKSATPLVVVVTTSEYDTIENVDYRNDAVPVTFAPGVTTGQSVEITIIDDTTTEPDEFFQVYLSEQNSPEDTSLVWVKIIDNDRPPDIDIADHNGTEGDEFFFPVTLSHPSTAQVSVAWETEDDSATSVTGDYTAASGVVTFRPGDTSKRVLVRTLEDDVDENSEVFRVLLDNAQNAEIGDGVAKGTITDDDDPPGCFVVPDPREGTVPPCDDCQLSAGSALESGGSIDLRVSLDAPSERERTVQYATRDDSAVAGSDYRGKSGAITISPGDTTGGVSVTLIDDQLAEDVEQFVFSLTNCEPANQVSPVYATIYDDDALDVAFSVDDAEADEDDGTIDFVVKLTQAPSEAASVSYETRDGTAVAGEDYTAIRGELEFAAGQRQRTVSVPVTDDDLREAPRETFMLVLSDPQNAVFVPGLNTTANGTIIDNEPLPGLSATDASGTEGSTISFPVRLNPAGTVEVTVEYRLKEGTAVERHDYENRIGTVRFGPRDTEQTVSVQLADDAISEIEETFTLELHTPVNATLVEGEATGTIVDNDPLPKILQREGASVPEERFYDFTPVLEPGSARSAYPIVLRVYSTHGTADGGDYEAFDETRTLPAGSSSFAEISIGTNYDLTDEPDEYLTINYEVVSGRVAEPASWSRRLTIVDDDGPPHAAMSEVTVDEGTAAAFEVKLTAASQQNISMRYASRYDTATAADFDAVAGTLTFARGETRKTILVHPVTDNLNEPDTETFTVELSEEQHVNFAKPNVVPGGFQGFAWGGVAIGTIRDIDPRPMMTISDETASEGDAEVMSFDVDMDVAHYETVLVDYTIRDVSAVRSDDYARSDYSGRLSLPAGTRNETIDVSVVDDDLAEGTETFEIDLEHPRLVIVGVEPPIDIGKSTGVGTILDDDINVSVDDVEGNEGDTVVFTISLAGAAGSPVSVDYELKSGTALAGADFEPASGQMSGRVRFEVGEDTKQVDVRLLDDLIDEDDETFVLELTAADGANIGADGSGTGKIIDTTPLPVLRIEPRFAGTEGDTVTVPVRLTGASSSSVTVGYTAVDGTASSGDDYRGLPGTLVFQPGDTAAWIAIELLADDVDEPDETFAVTLSNPANATLDDAAKTSDGTIGDDSDPPAVSVADASAEEGADLSFAVSLEGSSTQSVTVSFATSDGTAVATHDYEPGSGSLTFAPGETLRTIALDALDDDIHEQDETFTLTLSAPQKATLARDEATGTIVDTDPQPIISTLDAMGDEGTDLTFQVSLDGASSMPVTVRYATSDDTASEDDYTGQEGTLTFSGDTETLTVVVPLTDDTLDEPNERFNLDLSDAENAVIATPRVTGKITDNDDRPTISISDAADAVETGVSIFAVTLTGRSSRTVTVRYQLEDGTAIGGADYVADAGVVTFAPGEADHVIEVPLLDDEIDEPVETFGVRLGEARRATVAVAEASGSIIDDDGPPVLSISGGEGIEGSEIEFTIDMAGASSQPVTVNYATADGTATGPADYEPATGVLTFDPADDSPSLTVAVLLRSDNADEPDETFAMVLSAPVGATIGTASADGTIMDANDPPRLTVADAEGIEGQELAFELRLTGSSSRIVTVQYELLDVDARAGLDYEGDSGELAFEPGQETVVLTVTTLEDDIAESAEAFQLSLSAPVNAELADANARGLIEDNDDRPTISISDAADAVETGVSIFAVTLTGRSSRTVTVRYQLEDGTAIGGADYVADAGVVTFAPGEADHVIEVPLLDDEIDEPVETFGVRLGEARRATVAVAEASGSIIDDDGPPVLSISGGEGIEGSEIEFTIDMAGASSGPVTVNYATADGTATGPADYEPATGVLTFDPADDSPSLTVAVLLRSDNADEPDETFAMVLSAPVGATIGTASADGTIMDANDPPRLTVADAEGIEGQELAFELRLTGSSSRIVTVQYELLDVDARAGLDYEGDSGELTFEPGQETVVLTVTTLEDDIAESAEAFQLSLSAPVNAELADANARGLIEDNDDRPTISISDAADAVETGVSIFAVTLTGRSSRTVTVRYQLEDGTAIGGADYVADAGVVTFAPGEADHVIEVPLLDDEIDEPVETFGVRLGEARRATVAVAEASGSIIDDDGPPVLSISGGEGIEGSEIEFTIDMAGASSQPVTVNYATADGTATGPADYEPATGVLTFDPADDSPSLTVAVLLRSDNADEPDETFAMVLSAPVGATIGTASADGTIMDANDPPRLTVADAEGIEGQELAFELRLTGSSSRIVTVQYELLDVDARAGLDYEGDSGELTFEPGQETVVLTVTTLEDDIAESAEAFQLSLSAPVNAELADANARGLIEDNDDRPTISISDAADAVETGVSIFAVTLTGRSSRTVTVRYQLEDGTAIGGADYVADAGVVTFAPGEADQVIEVPLLDDEIDEPVETFGVRLGEARRATVAVAEASGSIIDDDGPPVLSISGGEGIEGSEIEFTIDMVGVSSQPVTVNYATADGTATGPADYEPATGVLTFDPADDSPSLTVAVPLRSDNADEPDETFAMVLSAPVGATIGTASADGTIMDANDPPRLTVADAEGIEGEELGFELRLTSSSSRIVTVQYELLDVDARAGLDYEGGSGELAFEPEQETVVLTVTTIEDDIDESDEVFQLLLSAPVNAELADANARGLIEDNDDPPTLSISDATPAEEGGTLRFSVELAGASSNEVTVPYRTIDGTATAGLDYRAEQGVLTFVPGESAHQIEIALLEDDIDEPEETLSVMLDRPRHAALVQASGVGSILDNDDPPALSIDDAVAVEGETLTFDVSLSTASSQSVTVGYGTSDGTALAGSDYTAAQGILTFAPFETTRAVAVSLLDDDLQEPDETLTVVLTSPTHATLASDTGVGTIADDDDAPVLSIEGASGEEGATIRFRVMRSGSIGQDVSVDYATADGTAEAGADYEATTGTLRLAAGQDSGEIPVRLLTDDADEGDERFTVDLSMPSGAVLALASGPGTIIDVNEAPELSVTGDVGNEGDSVEFVVTLSPHSQRAVTVLYETRNGSAQAGADYEFASGILTFGPGESSRIVAVSLLDDSIDEIDEVFSLVLSSPSNATLAIDAANATILDDDGAPSLSIDGGTAIEGGQIDFDVRLAGETGQAVTVRYATVDKTAQGGLDYVRTTGTLTFGEGQSRHTVPVPLIDDRINEPDETFEMVLSEAVGATLARPAADGGIVDNDHAALLSVADATASESSGEMTFAVSLDSATAEPVTVSYATSEVTAMAGLDFDATAGELTFAPGETLQTVSVRLLDDDADEPDETLNLTLSNVTNAVIASGNAVGTITDDDLAPALTVVGTRAREGEAATFEIRKNGSTDRRVTVGYRSSDGTASVGSDYTFTSGTLTFEPGTDSLTVPVRLLADDTDEPDETFYLNLSSPTGATLAVDSAEGVILDDTAAPTLSIGDTVAVEGATAVFEVTAAGSQRSESITVRYATVDGTAVAGDDYVSSSGTVTLEPDDRRAMISIDVLDDALSESDEEFSVLLSSPVGATLADESGIGTIADDDSSPLLVIAGAEGVEGGALEFVVTLRSPSGRPVTVDFATADGTALATADYEARAGTLRFAPGTTRQTIAIRLTDDRISERTETMLVVLSAPEGARLVNSTAEGSIEDNDSAPVLSVRGASGLEGSSLQFTVSLDGSSDGPVSVAYRTSDGSAVAGADYGAVAGMLTFAPGDGTATIEVQLFEDGIVEGDESFEIHLSSPSNAMIATPVATGTILDEPVALPELTVADAEAREADGEMLFEVTLSEAVGAEVSVDYRSADVAAGASSGSDYEAVRGTLRFEPFEIQHTIRVPILDDVIRESDESFLLLLAGPSFATLADDSATGTILDDDEPPALSIAGATGAEDAGELAFAVTLSAPSPTAVTVDYASTDGTAAAGRDYGMVEGTLAFAPGETAKTIRVLVIDDALDEADEETFAVALSAPTGATLDAGSATGDDPGRRRAAGAVHRGRDRSGGCGRTGLRGDPERAEPDGGDGGLRLHGRHGRGGPGLRDGRRNAGVRPGRNGEDDPRAGDRRRAGRGGRRDLRGDALGADRRDPGRRFRAGDDPGRRRVPGAVHRGRDRSGGCGRTGLRGDPERAEPDAVTVDYASTDGTAAAGRDYRMVEGTLAFAPGETAKTIRVPVIDDALDEADEETFAVTLSAPTGATLDAGSALGTILDDDESPALSVADAAGDEDVGSLEFEVTLSAPSGIEVSASYATADGSATAGSDYTATTGTLLFAPGEVSRTIRVAILDDALYEADEEIFSLALSALQNATAADDSATGTIRDNDLAPPSVAGDLPAALLCVGGAPYELDLAGYFDGKELRFSAVSSTPLVATATLAGSRLTVAPASEGESSVTVTATNEAGSVSGSIGVRVVKDPAELEAVESVLASIGRAVLTGVTDSVRARFDPRSAIGEQSASTNVQRGRTQVVPGASAVLGNQWPGPAMHGVRSGGWDGSGLLEPQVSGDDWFETTNRTYRRGMVPFSFSLDSARSGSTGPAWAVWGRADAHRFESGSDGNSHDGTLTAVHLGADARVGDWLAGVSVARSAAEADYQFERSVDACGGGGTGEGMVDAELTSVHPYVGRQIGRGSVWATLGAGSGEVSVERCETGRRNETDLSMRLAALGGRHPFAGGERMEVSVVEEISVLDLTTGDAPGPVGDRSVSVGQARLGLEAAGVATPGCNCSLTTFVRGFARGDWGDGATGAGLELAAGVRFRNLPQRLGIDAGIRALAVHSAEDAKEHSANLTFSLLPKVDGTGWQASLAWRRGASDARFAALGGNSPWTAPSGSLPGAETHWIAESRLGYGIRLPRGYATPFVELDAGYSGRGGARFGVRHEFGDRERGLVVEWGIEPSSLASSGNRILLEALGRF